MEPDRCGAGILDRLRDFRRRTQGICSSLKTRGRKTKEWEKARRILKARFSRAGIERCEFRFDGCWGNSALSFAHAKKRRELAGNELFEVALCCAPCHDKLERMSHAVMWQRVQNAIARRAIQP